MKILLPRTRLLLLVAALLVSGLVRGADAPPSAPGRDAILAAMKRASTFMIEHAGGKRGAYVWSYLADRSRRWGEMEATPTMLWIQGPGAPAMGQLFLDAYHVTRDEFYYDAAAQVAEALIKTQHPSGGWNYIGDLAGEEALKKWYATIGRNGWRLEEFQHYYGNATFDDETTITAARFMRRIAGEKAEPRFRSSVERALQFVLKSQLACGGWPQRFPPTDNFSKNGQPDYTGFVTLNDDVASANVDFLIESHGLTHRPELLAAARRGMDSFIALQQAAPQAGWALQYTPDLKPAGARSYEPRALVTHTTAACIGHLLDYFELTGDRKYLARIPEALDWLDRVKLPPNTPGARGTHPTFLEVGTDRPLYIHRAGSNAASGRYFADHNSENTIGHYSSFRTVDTAALRARYAAAAAKSSEELARKSPLRSDAPQATPPRIVSRAGGFFGGGRGGEAPISAERVAQIVSGLHADGYWPAVLRSTSHPYRGEPPAEPGTGDFSRTQVGDNYDTSPYTNPERVTGLTTASFVGNMATLLRFLDAQPQK